jgi:hypothetical protein
MILIFGFLSTWIKSNVYSITVLKNSHIHTIKIAERINSVSKYVNCRAKIAMTAMIVAII